MVLTISLAVCPGIAGLASADGPDTAGTRLAGVRMGPHAVGFDVIHSADPTRIVNPTDGGTKVGIATWYPAHAATGQAMTALQYRQLGYLVPPDPRQQRDIEDDEVESLRAWRHIGIVDLRREQARASLHTRGVAVRGAAATEGRFPVVVVLGGAHYLSSTAEALASHGFLVVAAFRYADQSNEIGASGFAWYLENSVRDAEWALSELRAHPHADLRHVSAIGHGGGGMIAMLFAMRNRSVDALVNIDAGNFSQRSAIRDNPLYSRRLMRAPYLYIATASTRKSQDQFEEFEGMTFSARFEVALDDAELRHHDLSDYGRAVTAPMAIRGAPQTDVQQRYVDVHDMAVRFLLERSERAPAGGVRFGEWLSAQRSPRTTVTMRPGTEPAPTVVRLLETVDARTLTALEDARRRDPEAPVFEAQNLSRLVSKAIAVGDLESALGLADFSVGVHPNAPALHALKSQVLEARGDMAGARRIAVACGALQANNDWRATLAITQCNDRALRLR